MTNIQKRVLIPFGCGCVVLAIAFMAMVLVGAALEDAERSKPISVHLDHYWVVEKTPDGSTVYYDDRLEIVSVAWSSGSSREFMVTARYKDKDVNQYGTFRIIADPDVTWLWLPRDELLQKAGLPPL